MPKKLAKQSTSGSIASSLSTSSTLPNILSDAGPLPRLIVFDLDYTLWPFWVDTHVYSPIKSNADHSACTDKIGETFAFYGDIPAILHGMTMSGIKMGVASRSCAPDLAREMLKLLHIPPASTLFADGEGAEGSKKKDKSRKAIEFFDSGIEIYPKTKLVHFEAIAKKTGIAYTDMLFFDDESRNREVEQMGVTMQLVRDGVTWRELESGIRLWRNRRGRRESHTNGQ